LRCMRISARLPNSPDRAPVSALLCVTQDHPDSLVHRQRGRLPVKLPSGTPMGGRLAEFDHARQVARSLDATAVLARRERLSRDRPTRERSSAGHASRGVSKRIRPSLASVSRAPAPRSDDTGAGALHVYSLAEGRRCRRRTVTQPSRATTPTQDVRQRQGDPR
jgi:hypothetical protein